MAGCMARPTGGRVCCERGLIVKTSEMFTQAKKFLDTADEDRGNLYICHALMDVEASTGMYHHCTAIIDAKLEGWHSAKSWLDNERNVRLSRGDLQTWRHMWLDRLIAEFEAKGD